MVWFDELWQQNGVVVCVSLFGFDNGMEMLWMLNDGYVGVINVDLNVGIDVKQVQKLLENVGVSFIGIQKGGVFDILGDLVCLWLSVLNLDRVSNVDVLKFWVNGMDLMCCFSGCWIIDFVQMDEGEVRQYL